MPTLDELTGGGTSLDELTQETSQPGIGERIISGLQSGPGRVLSMLSELPGQMLTGGRIATEAASNLVTGKPQSPELADLLRGALESLTLGGVKAPEGASPEAVSAGQAVGGAIGMIPAVRGAKAALGAIPAVGNLASKLAVPLVGALQGGGAAAIQGGGMGDIAEEAAGGFSAGGTAQTVGAAGKMALRGTLHPMSQVFSIEERNAQNRITNAQRILEQQQELQLRKIQNIEALKQHTEALRTAENNAAASNQAAAEAFRTARVQAETQLSRAQAELPGAQERFLQMAERSKPGERPSDLYGPVNEAVLKGAPSDIPLANTSGIIERVGGGIAKQTEGLPRAAGPSGRVEKLATGLAEEISTGADPKSQLIAQLSPELKASFSKGMLESMTETQLQRYLQADKVAKATGVAASDVVALGEGNLNIGQIDRLLQVFGKASSKSGVASEFFWGLQEDLRGAAKTGNPLAQQLLDARRAWRQQVASDDLGRIASPAWSPTGKLQVNAGKVASIMDPRNTNTQATRIRESFPPEIQADIRNTLAEVFRVQEGVRTAASNLRSLPKHPPAPVKPAKVAAPSLADTEVAPAKLLPDQPMQYVMSRKGMLRHPIMLAAGAAYVINKMFGLDLSYAAIGSGFVGLVSFLPEQIFKAGVAISRTQRGRDFLRTLFRNEPPNLNNPESLQAMLTFLGVEAERQQREQQ